MFLGACGPGAKTSGPVFEQAWVRPVPTGMKMTAGFGTVSNPGKEAIVFNSFSSPSFGEVSLHRTEKLVGVTRMREVDELRLEPGDSALLEPGGFHLMLMKPNSEVEAGQTVTIVMTTDDGRSFPFDVPVEGR